MVMGFRLLFCGLPFIAAVMVSFQARAVTLNGLKNQGFAANYGSYAPRGDCALAPRVTIDDAGFTFLANGRTVQPKRFEWAVSYMGPSYNGIAAVFFPFPVNDNDYGRVLMIVNEDEKRGTIGFHSNVGPGQRLDAMEAALVKASPLSLCRGKSGAAPAPAASAPASVAGKAAGTAAAASARAVPLDWNNLAALAGKYDGDFDAFNAGPIASALRALMGNKMAVLKANMAVAGPLKRQGALYYLSGNAPHQGGEDQAYILMDAGRKAVQVGLWERGKLTTYGARAGQIALPADIKRMLDASPPEHAVAAPGKPWEVVPVQGRTPLAYVDAAASPSIKSFSLFCDKGRPAMAMLTNKPLGGNMLKVSWVFAGGMVDVQVARSNREGTFWQAYLSGSPLLPMLMRQSGKAYLRINDRMEGEAALAGSGAAMRTALRTCQRF